MKSLSQWLAYQQQMHARAVDLGLERVDAVWQRLGAPKLAARVISVGGTNGKGSCVAMLEAMLSTAGHATGCYTSPHLIRYNERVRVCGREVDDVTLIAAFEKVERARGDITLTWFEFGTLAALLVFADASLDTVMLEVGLGGRLDAVNIIDADVSVVTTVALDHMAWLGADRDSIGHEKAGIFRRHRPAIVGDASAPQGLLQEADRIGARVLRAGHDFGMLPQVDAWCWWMHDDQRRRNAYAGEVARIMMPNDATLAPGALSNTAAALAAMYVLREELGWQPDKYVAALSSVCLVGRAQRFPGPPEIVIDVAHNPQAAAALAQWLDSQPTQKPTTAVFSALADKDIPGIVAALGERVRHWHVCALPDAEGRGLEPAEVERRLRLGVPGACCSQHADPLAALAAARADAAADARILAFGSFHLAGAVLSAAGRL